MKIKVEFTVDLKREYSEDDIQEWLNFELGKRGSIRCENLLCDKELEGRNIIWEKE